MSDPFRDTLLRGVESLGLDELVGAEAIEKFCAYQALLTHWNRTHRLVGSTAPVTSAEGHFVDSLALLPLIVPATSRSADPEREIVDLGSGAGFPGAVLAVVLPRFSFRLVEPLAKRIAFLNAVRAGIGLPNVRLVRERAEGLAPASVRLLVSRATLPPDAYLAEASRLLVPGGRVILMAAHPPSDELERAAGVRGLHLVDTRRWVQAFSGAPRVNTAWEMRPGDDGDAAQASPPPTRSQP